MSAPTLRERRQQQTLEEVSAAAVGLFVSQGFAETTVEQIAAAGGISVRTFHRYFATKAESASPFLETGWRTFIDALAARPAADDVTEAVAAALEESWGSDVSRRHRTFLRTIPDVPELRPVWLSINDRCAEALAPLLAHRVGVAPDAARATFAARCVVAATRTAVETWAHHPRRPVLPTLQECLALVPGLLTPS